MTIQLNNLLLSLTAISLGVSVVAAFTPTPLSTHPSLLGCKSPSRLQAINNYLEDGNYNQVILKNDKAVLVDACATWCGPCKLMEPFLEKAAQKFEGELDLVKFDVDAGHDNVKVELLLQDALPKALPSFILFKGGKAITKKNGVMNQEELEEFIATNLKKASSSKKEPELAEASSKKGFIHFGGERDDYAL